MVDYLLGLEKEDHSNPSSNKYYKTFSSPIQRILTAYCQSGGKLLVSGSYIASDMNDNQGNRDFTQNILKYSFGGTLRISQSTIQSNTENDKQAKGNGSNDAVTTINGLGRNLTIPNLPNEKTYPVISPDIIQPVGTAFPVMLYATNNQCAATAYTGYYRTFVMGFPFESIAQESDRNAVMASILQFFEQGTK